MNRLSQWKELNDRQNDSPIETKQVKAQMDSSEKKPPPLEARAVGKAGIVIGTPAALDARERRDCVSMEFDNHGDWLFTDPYGQVWRLRPTADPSMPLTITLESK